MKYYKPQDFRKLVMKLNPQEFVAHMCRIGEIKKISNDYSNDVYKLCNNAVAWALGVLKDTIYFYSIQVVEGTFDGDDHTWLQLGDYYIDLTLAQFVSGVPQLAITKAKESTRYKQDIKFDATAWAKKEVEARRLR